jgi:hypothetical protein
VAAGGAGADGRVPVPVEEHAHVRGAVAALAAAQERLRAAENKIAADVVPAAPRKANTTDPASRVMPGKNEGFGQRYNAQVLATARQIIVAIMCHDNPNDVQALHPLLAEGQANLAAAGIPEIISKALFDAGYASADNFTAEDLTRLYVACLSESRQTGRHPTPDPPKINKGWEDMTARLSAEEGKKLYRKRAGIIEPVFGQLFQRLGHSLNYRGVMVDIELSLWATTHNLGKLIKHRTRTAQSAA